MNKKENIYQCLSAKICVPINLKRMEIFKLAVSFILCQLAGVMGSIFTRPAIGGWYATLRKPSFTPPDWVFAPVWIILYSLMGVAAYLVWRKGLGEKQVRKAMILFSGQLILNALWSWIFFGLRSPLAGFVEIAILSVVLIFTIQSFFKISKPAGALLIPYFLWVAFASGLNLSIWVLN
jgi:tryptophan-rich sensory protein